MNDEDENLKETDLDEKSLQNQQIESDKLDPSESLTSIGQILKSAREKLALNISDVARSVYLKRCVIENIENDNFKNSETLIFNRGYVRLYARYLDLDEKYILQLYDEKYNKKINTKDTPSLKLQTFSELIAKRRKNLNINKLCIFGFLSFLFFIIIYANLNTNTDENQIFIDDLELVNDTLIQNLESDLEKTNAIVYDNKILNELELNASIETEPNINLKLIADIDSLDEIKTKNNTDQAKSATDDLIEEEAKAEISRQDSNQIDLSKENLLQFEFFEDCWLEVKNSANKIIFSGTKTQGDILDLKDSMPYKLVIGNPDALSIQLSDEKIDLAKYKGRVARFEIDK